MSRCCRLGFLNGRNRLRLADHWPGLCVLCFTDSDGHEMIFGTRRRRCRAGLRRVDFISPQSPSFPTITELVLEIISWLPLPGRLHFGLACRSLWQVAVSEVWVSINGRALNALIQMHVRVHDFIGCPDR